MTLVMFLQLKKAIGKKTHGRGSVFDPEEIGYYP
jgi:hypothetical protein